MAWKQNKKNKNDLMVRKKKDDMGKKNKRGERKERKNEASEIHQSSDDETLNTTRKILMRWIYRHYGKPIKKLMVSHATV